MNNNDMKPLRGIGVNGTSYISALRDTMSSTENQFLPPSASWPFVGLYVKKNSVIFRMLSVHKIVRRKDVTVSLNRLGCLYFRTPDHASDFGFIPFRLGNLLKILSANNYSLEESCMQNLRIANLVMVLNLIVGLSALIAGAIAANLLS
jgi:hypothetical protein